MINCKTMACACAALLCIAPARAQDDAPSSPPNTLPLVDTKSPPTGVQIYGLLDEGVQYLNNAAVAGKASGNVYELGAGMTTSFFGFRGAEHLGNGTSIVFDLEGGLSPNNGTSLQGGRLFGRQAYVGIEGTFGRLTLGRQYTMKSFATAPINMFGTGAQGITTLDNGVANPRADNAISYRVSVTKELEVGVNYSFGRDGVAGTPVSAAASNCGGETAVFKQCKEESAMAKYTARNWGLESAYERNNGGTAATFGGLTNPNLYDSRLILGGYRQIDNVKLAVGLIKRNNMGIATPKSNLVWVMGTLTTANNIAWDGMLAQLKYDDSPNKAVAVGLRAAYSLSKRTVLYITAETIRNSGTSAISASTLIPVNAPPAGGSQTSIITGIKHNF